MGRGGLSTSLLAPREAEQSVPRHSEAHEDMRSVWSLLQVMVLTSPSANPQYGANCSNPPSFSVLRRHTSRPSVFLGATLNENFQAS